MKAIRSLLYPKDKIGFSHRTTGNWIIMFVLLSTPPPLSHPTTIINQTSPGFCDKKARSGALFCQNIDTRRACVTVPVLSWSPDSFLRRQRWFVWSQWGGRKRPLSLVTIIGSEWPDHQQDVHLTFHDHEIFYGEYKQDQLTRLALLGKNFEVGL